VLDSYGCRETSLNAMECRQQRGLHVAMENNYLEVDGGRILVTNLNNRAMPLIRYEIGDRAEAFLAGQCACGRGLERLARVEGRTSDTLRFGKRIVHAEYITHLFYTDTPITRFQVIKNEQQNRLTLLVDKQDNRLEQSVRQSLERKFPGTTIVVRVTQDFIKTSTGKTRLVVDEADV
jgi:phenylacetate-CoA ligase